MAEEAGMFMVELRQHVSHRRTLFYLEQLILKHGVAVSAVRIKQMDQGIDFFFSNRSHAIKFVEFIRKVVPVKSHHDIHLFSHDPISNICIYQNTFSVEICPVCREDLICLPREVSVRLGNLGPIVICTKVTDTIALLDPFTLRHHSLDANQYWMAPFKSLLTSRRLLVKYIVMDVKVVSSEVTIGGKKYVLADAQVARVSDVGKNDKMFYIRTHLGHVLNPGDYALGYDPYGANINDIDLDKYRGLSLPPAILIKKCYEEKCQKKFPDLRFNISLHQNREYHAEGLPSVPLEELLADLDLSEEEDEEDNMSE